MKGHNMAYLLLAATFACTGCRTAPPTVPGGAQSKNQDAARPLSLPDAFFGVWYSSDAEGAPRCVRYPTLPPAESRHDGVDPVPPGSLVITPDLIHEVAEYGEGNFHVVERVEPEGGGAWRITTRLGIDSMPEGNSEEESVISRLSLRAGKLQWEHSPQLGRSTSIYARCDAVQSPVSPA